MVNIENPNMNEPTISREKLEEYISDVKRYTCNCPELTGKVHKLKILPEYFSAVLSGKKTFELRKNDHDYKVGDVVELQEYTENRYTGRAVEGVISYVLKSCSEYGLDDSYCIFSFILTSK